MIHETIAKVIDGKVEAVNASTTENDKGVSVKYTFSQVYKNPDRADSGKEETVYVEAEGGGIPAIGFHVSAKSMDEAITKAHKEIDMKLRYYAKK